MHLIVASGVFTHPAATFLREDHERKSKKFLGVMAYGSGIRGALAIPFETPS
jgi:hypothetical protein